MKRILTSLLLAGLCTVVSAQGLKIYGLRLDSTYVPGNFSTGDLEVVSVNPNTAGISSLYGIPGSFASGSATFDQARNRFIFWGIDDQNVDRFYAVDMDDGSYISPAIQGAPPLKPIELQYDMQVDTTIGLWYDTNNQTEYLVSLNLQTGLFDTIGAIAGVQYIALGSSGYNSNHHRFTFIGLDANQSTYFYYVDALSGQIVSQVALTDSVQIVSLQYDNVSDQLFALYGKRDSSQFDGITYFNEIYLGTIDTTTAAITQVSAQPILSGFRTGVAVFGNNLDHVSGTIVINGVDDQFQQGLRLMIIDIDDGTIIADNPLYTFSQSVSAVNHIAVDNSVFARLAYGEDTTSTTATLDPEFNQGVTIYPNPVADRLIVRFPESLQPSMINVFNMEGKLVMTEKIAFSAGEELGVNVSALPAGIYTILGETEGRLVFGKKWSKQ